MTNSVYALADFLDRFPIEERPETTEGRDGFAHPYTGSLGVDESTIKVLLRDFEDAGLDAKEANLREMVRQTGAKFPTVKIELQVQQNYRNMKVILDEHPELMTYAMDAAKRAGLAPFLKSIRGGTDGSQLTFRGLPCPNLFTGGHNFHGKLEFNSRRGLEKTLETLVYLVQGYAKR